MPFHSKYDRRKLFIDYLSSEEDSVVEFLKSKGIVKAEKKSMNGNMANQTIRWLAKKNAIRERAMQRAVEKATDTMAEKVYKPSIKELSDMHQRAIAITKVALNDLTRTTKGANGEMIITINPKAAKISKELKDLREIIKVEKKEPTKYIEDLTPPQDAELSEKQKALLQKFKRKNK